MLDMGAEMRELMMHMSAARGGTKSFEDYKALTPEEKAERDAQSLNREIGHEDQVDGYACEKCRNRGYIYHANGKYVVRADCECRKARQSIRRLRNSGLGDVISKYTFQRYNATADWQRRIKDTAQVFLKDDTAKWFFIGGQSGGGKTHICTAICRNLLAEYDVHYMLWESESVELKSMITDAEPYQNRMIRLKNVDVLYIDDFFSKRKERVNDADIRLAREILNHRYLAGKITIISSEWYVAEIADVDAALGGRIIEMCGQYCFNIGRTQDNNYRLRFAN